MLCNKNLAIQLKSIDPTKNRPVGRLVGLGHHHYDIRAKKNSGNHAHCGNNVDMIFLALADLLLLAGTIARLLASGVAPCGGLLRGFG